MTKTNRISMLMALVISAAGLRAGAEPAALLEVDPSMRTAPANSEDLGGGFHHHGPASHVGHQRGLVSTANANGESIVLVWLSGDSILEINVETGHYREHENPHSSRGPFASLLSSDNTYYAVSDHHFLKFDPQADEPRIELIAETEGRDAYSMIEDDEGIIWAALGTESGLVRYDPETGEFHDYGTVYERQARFYPRFLAADDQGWLYITFTPRPTQILMIERETGEVNTAIPEPQRGGASNRLWRAADGKVYSPGVEGRWVQLHGGEATWLEAAPDIEREYGTHKSPMNAHFVSGSQGLEHRDLPNGERVVELDLASRRLTIEDPETGETRDLAFDYEGGDRSLVMSVESTSVGTIAGGATYPARFFSYDPRTDRWTRGDIYRQWNATTTTQDGIFYAGLYTEGVMLEWDPASKWVATERDNPKSNPLYLDETRAHPHIWRPSDILVYPGDRYVILAGWSSQGTLGGGLSFWDRETQTAEILTHEDLIRYHNSAALAPLPEDRLLVGTTTTQRGGEVRAEGYAKLYVLNMKNKQIEWKQTVEGTQSIYDMWAAADGRVFLVEASTGDRWNTAEHDRMFVFDPELMELTHEIQIPERFEQAAWGNAPRVFVPTPDGRIFMLFRNAILELDPQSHELEQRAEPPAGLMAGGAFLEGRLYFTANRSHLYSWEVPSADGTD